MKNTLSLTIVAASILAITTSCDALLNPTSLFASLDKPDTGAAASKTGDALLSVLEKNSGSATFYKSLTTKQKTTISANLDSLIASGTPEQKAQASVAKADLYVLTDSTLKQSVNDVVGIVSTLASGDATPSVAEVTEPLTASLRSKLSSYSTTEEKVAVAQKFLEDMATISAAYSSLSSALTEESGTVDTALVDLDMGDVQTCLVAEVFDSIGSLYPDNASAASALVDFLDANATIDDSNIGQLIPGGDVSTLTTALNTKIDTLKTVTSAVGVDTLTEQINQVAF